MKELIKEAKWLYFQIENTQEKLVKSRLRNEKDNEHTALIELETEMCATLQLLKCIIDRKDNIVDLGEVWHDISVEPRYDNKSLVFENKDGFITYCSNKSKVLKIWNPWKNLSLSPSIRWAYVEDLLQKGGK